MGIGQDLKHGVKAVPLWGWGAMGLGALYLFYKHSQARVSGGGQAPVVLSSGTPITAGVPDTSGAAAGGSTVTGPSAADISAALAPYFGDLSAQEQAYAQQNQQDIQGIGSAFTSLAQQEAQLGQQSQAGILGLDSAFAAFVQQSQGYQAQLLAALSAIGQGAGPPSQPPPPPTTQPPPSGGGATSQPPAGGGSSPPPPITQPPSSGGGGGLVLPPPPPTSQPPSSPLLSFLGLNPVSNQPGYYTIGSVPNAQLTGAIQWNGTSWAGFNAASPIQVIGTASAPPVGAPASGQIQVTYNQAGNVQGSVVLTPAPGGGYYYYPFLTPAGSSTPPPPVTNVVGQLTPPVTNVVGVLAPPPPSQTTLRQNLLGYGSPYAVPS